jgi:hypothetical protein
VGGRGGDGWEAADGWEGRRWVEGRQRRWEARTDERAGSLGLGGRRWIGRGWLGLLR